MREDGNATDEQRTVHRELTFDDIKAAHLRVVNGIDAAVRNHKPFPSDPVRAVGIVTEEVGEAMQAALGMTRERPSCTRRRLIEELTDTASAAILALATQLRELEKEAS